VRPFINVDVLFDDLGDAQVANGLARRLMAVAAASCHDSVLVQIAAWSDRQVG
jgi:hypothetical protein